MRLATLRRLRCPNCINALAGDLALSSAQTHKEEVISGSLSCAACESQFPILAGVAILVSHPESYLRMHALGLAPFVTAEDLPERYREAIAQGLSETDASEEDQESERVNALYFMNHYLRADPAKAWWRPTKNFSPEIDRLVKKFWNQGPFAHIGRWLKKSGKLDAIELGCGTGGLARAIAPHLRTYLGVDTSFVSIALARHLNLGAPYPLSLRLPQDLLLGPQTKQLPPPKPPRGVDLDFVVAELENLPVSAESFDLTAALNVIDVIEDPAALPHIQFDLLRKGGLAIQSSPYLWNADVAAHLHGSLPKKIKSSSEAATYLYRKAGFSLIKSAEHVPWIFLEHFRKIGFFSAHLFMAKKDFGGRSPALLGP